MNNLAINIEYLLLSRNCVIVPSLGAFNAIDTPARWVGDEEMFLPPVRHIRFDINIQVDPNDCLVRSLAETYNWTIDVARKRCQSMVEDFHKSLISEGTVDFGSIGIFTLEDDAEITFSSCECGVIAPEYYGLDTLHFSNIAIEKRATKPNKSIMEIIPEQIISGTMQNTDNTNQTTKQETGNVKDDTHYTISVSKSAVNYAMAIAATIALFFIMRPTTVSTNDGLHQIARPVMFLQPEMVKQNESLTLLQELDITSDNIGDSTAVSDNALIDITDELTDSSIELTNSFNDIEDSSNELTKSTNEVQNSTKVIQEFTNKVANVSTVKTTTTTSTTTKVANASEKASKTPDKAAASEKVNKTPEKALIAPVNIAKSAETNAGDKFCIVLASGVSRANAEVFVSKLSKENIKASIVEGELRRVVIDGFASYEAAHKHMAALKATGNCQDAWVLKK